MSVDYLFGPHPITATPIVGDNRLFPVHRIYCVGRNYAEHSREMGSDPTKEAPFFFMKPADALIASGSTLAYPQQTQNLHHEIELVIALGQGGTNIRTSNALNCIFGYGVGIDLTRRDRQFEAKKAGRPWDEAKGFDQSAPLSALAPATAIGHPGHGKIWLSVNGVERQCSNIADMIWSVPEIISILSRSFELKAGDLIFTGTPAGVGPLVPGDYIEGGIEGVARIEIKVSQ